MIFKRSSYTKLRGAALLGCFLSLLLLAGCWSWDVPPTEDQQETITDENGVVTSLPFVWKTDITDKGSIFGGNQPLFYKDIVVVRGAPDDYLGMLVALDVATGEEVWRWNDYVEGYDFEEVLTREQLNVKDNIVIFNNNNRFCAVDLDTGEALWKDKREGSSNSSAIQVVGDDYYFPFELIRNNIEVQTLMRGSVHSPVYEKIAEAPIEPIQFFDPVPPIGFYGSLKVPYVYTENGDIHAFLAFSENKDLYQSQSLISYISYNLSDGTPDFEKARLPGTATSGVIWRPVMIGEMMIFCADESIHGVNRHTGELVWTGDIPAKNGSYVGAAYKGRYFAVNWTGGIPRVMELDPLTGKTIWMDEGNGGDCEPALYFLNDVLYFVSRGDGHLYAYDVNGGRLLWNLDPPSYREYFNVLATLEGSAGEDKGVLVATTYKNAYRYEPVR